MVGSVNLADPRSPVASFYIIGEPKIHASFYIVGGCSRLVGLSLEVLGVYLAFPSKFSQPQSWPVSRISSHQYMIKCRLARILANESRSDNRKTEAID